jgi:predicted transcriptional regulator
MPNRARSIVLTLRVPPEVERSIARAARRRRRTKSAVLREVLESAFAGGEPAEDPESEARRQSLLVSGRASERDALRFVERAADFKGWR